MRCLLLICLLFVARFSSGQVACDIAVDIDHQCLVGSSSNQYGLQQCSGWLNVKNYRDVGSFLEGQKMDGVWGRWTNVWFGSHHFRVGLPAAAVAIIGLFILLLFAWLIEAVFHSIFNGHGKAETHPAASLP